MLKLLLDENLRSDALWHAIATQCESANLQDSADIKRVSEVDAAALGTLDDVLTRLFLHPDLLHKLPGRTQQDLQIEGAERSVLNPHLVVPGVACNDRRCIQSIQILVPQVGAICPRSKFLLPHDADLRASAADKSMILAA